MSDRWEGLLWPPERLPDALEALAGRCGLSSRAVAAEGWPSTATQEQLQQRVDGAAAELGIDAEPVELRHGDVPQSVRRRAPLLLTFEHHGRRMLVAIASSGRSAARLVVPGGAVVRVEAEALFNLLRAAGEAADLTKGAEEIFGGLALPTRARSRVMARLFTNAVGPLVVAEGWMLRPANRGSVLRQMWHAEVPQAAAAFLAVETLSYGAWIGSWWLLGQAALKGSLTVGWFAAWLLALLSTVPLRLWSMRLQALVAVGAGALFKRRVVDGALKLEPDENRAAGVGQSLGRAIECESIEAMALGGGFLSLAALLELAVAFVILWSAGGGAVQALLLAGWLAVAIAAAWLLLKRRRAWTEERLELTLHLVESMVGYRTRLAQERPEDWHREEDRALARYIMRSRSVDRSGAALFAVIPRGWLIVGLLGLAPVVSGSQTAHATALAVGIGGVLLAYSAFTRMTTGLATLVDSAVAWGHIKPLAAASGRASGVAAGAVPAADVPATTTRSGDAVMLEARGVRYRYGARSEAALRDCDLGIRAGERVLLEGASGSGKSTFASVLGGLRRPEAGVVLLRGLDVATLGGQAWRRKVVMTPQFHDNHVLAETLLFNLLMGRRWPANQDDARLAHEICIDLGLGRLIAKMPAGLHQVVGDTGWQLSHGERSRLFLARSLLQPADLLVFDESLAALDPMTLEVCLRCILKRAPATLLIAHP